MGVEGRYAVRYRSSPRPPMMDPAGYREIAQVGVMFDSGRRTSLFVAMKTMEGWSGDFLKHLNGAIGRGWVSEYAMKNGVRYGLTKVGRRELDAYQRLLRSDRA